MKRILPFLFICGCTPKPAPAPTPPPPPAPVVELPTVYKIKTGNAVTLQVQPQAGVTYTWSNGMTGPSITFIPTSEGTYRVTGTNEGGSASAIVGVVLE